MQERTDSWLGLVGVGPFGVSVAVLTAQYLFRQVDHFSLFHVGTPHGRFGLPFGLFQLLLSPGRGILWFFPFLAWGLWGFLSGGEVYLPAIIFFAVHAAYQSWDGGTGFSVRYLVPMLPLMVMAVKEASPKSRLFYLAVGYSLFWGCIGGLSPALVYDRSPWSVFQHILSKTIGPR